MFRRNSCLNKINHLETNKLDVCTLRKDHQEFTKNNQLTLKTQQRFKSKRYNDFTKEINKINKLKKLLS